MKKHLAAVALAVVFAQPAWAVTFPSLTTIYVGTGVEDSGGGSQVGTATVFQCSNVSGVSSQIRILVLQGNGSVAGQFNTTLSHGAVLAISTHGTLYWNVGGSIAPGTEIILGTVNIETTQSGVFCQAYLVDASSSVPSGVPIDLVRVNPHPGTVE